MKPRTYIEYVLDETYKFNLQSSIFNQIYNFLIDQYKIIKQKQYILLLSQLMCKKHVRTKMIRGKTFINIWITKVKLFCCNLWKKCPAGVLSWHYNVIRIWPMSGSFSRILVILYSLSPLSPFKNVFPAHFHFCEELR